MDFKKMFNGESCLGYLLSDGRVQDLEDGMFDTVEAWDRHRDGLPGNLILYYPRQGEDCPVPEVSLQKILK